MRQQTVNTFALLTENALKNESRVTLYHSILELLIEPPSGKSEKKGDEDERSPDCPFFRFIHSVKKNRSPYCVAQNMIHNLKLRNSDKRDRFGYRDVTLLQKNIEE